nr:hypothetical protein [Clostridium estertheticum]
MREGLKIEEFETYFILITKKDIMYKTSYDKILHVDAFEQQ